MGKPTTHSEPSPDDAVIDNALIICLRIAAARGRAIRESAINRNKKAVTKDGFRRARTRRATVSANQLGEQNYSIFSPQMRGRNEISP